MPRISKGSARAPPLTHTRRIAPVPSPRPQGQQQLPCSRSIRNGQLQRTPPAAHVCALQGGRPPKPHVLFRRARLAREAQGLLGAPRDDLCAHAPRQRVQCARARSEHDARCGADHFPDAYVGQNTSERGTQHNCPLRSHGCPHVSYVSVVVPRSQRSATRSTTSSSSHPRAGRPPSAFRCVAPSPRLRPRARTLTACPFSSQFFQIQGTVRMR